MTAKFDIQLKKRAMLVALPRAFELNSSGVISQVIGPGPTEKKIMNPNVDIIVTYLNPEIFGLNKLIF